MCASVMVIGYDVKFKDSISPELVDIYVDDSAFKVTTDEVIIPKYVWFNQEFFDADLDELYAFCRDENVKVKGDIYVVRRESETSDPMQQHIKLKSTSYDINECTFNITVKSANKTKRKPLTEEEKIALYKEYWDAKRKPPPPKEVYKEFRIGTFYASCKKNGDLLQIIEDIQNDK